FRALEKAIPERTIAAHHADLLVCLINGISPKDGRLFLAGIGPSGGGFGAKLTEDGVSATVCLNDGDTHNHPVEQMEAKYPVLFERHALREDSGGAGRYRGGGGFGPPDERDPEKVAHDVRQGHVSREIAREIYRVALDAAGNVDRKGTEILRRQ